MTQTLTSPKVPLGMVAIKVTDETMALIGATSTADFNSKLSAFVTEANQNRNTMAENAINMADVLKRVEALEARADLAPRLESLEKRTLTTEQVRNEASNEAAKVLGSVGTTAVKPAPAAALEPTGEELLQAGNYEAAFKADCAAAIAAKKVPEFDSLESFTAFHQANNAGLVKIL